jgi:hypothetical protein
MSLSASTRYRANYVRSINHLFKYKICVVHSPLNVDSTDRLTVQYLLVILLYCNRQGPADFGANIKIYNWDRQTLCSNPDFLRDKTSLTAFMLWPSYNGHVLGSFFLRGVSPSKMGHIALFLATIQPFSKARVFLYT